MALTSLLPIHGQSYTVMNLEEFGLPEIPVLGINSQLRAKPGLATHQHKGAMEICYLVKGEAVFSVDGNDYPMKGNDIFWTHPDELHGTGCHAVDKCLLYWTQIVLPTHPQSFLGLGKKVAWPLVQDLRTLPLRKFRGHRKLMGLFEDAFRLSKESPSAIQRIELASIMTQWLITVAKCASQGISQQYSADIKRALELVAQDHSEPLSVGDLARVAGLSESRFKAKFREQMGITPGEYVMRQRIQHARMLLEKTQQSVTEIAHCLGFSSSQYFANVFRRFMLIKPSDVRKLRR